MATAVQHEFTISGVVRKSGSAHVWEKSGKVLESTILGTHNSGK